MGIFENFDALRVRTSLSSWIISNSRFAVYDMPSWSHFWATRTILIFTLKRNSYHLFQRNLNHPIFKNISGNITNCQDFLKNVVGAQNSMKNQSKVLGVSKRTSAVWKTVSGWRTSVNQSTASSLYYRRWSTLLWWWCRKTASSWMHPPQKKSRSL